MDEDVEKDGGRGGGCGKYKGLNKLDCSSFWNGSCESLYAVIRSLAGRFLIRCIKLDSVA